MSSPESVTYWMSQLKAGDHDAAQKLWERYFQKMVLMARKKLGDAPRRAMDEEDVALGAFNSFCTRAEQGRFPELHDRDQLWALLLTITERKVLKLLEHEFQQKRDVRKTQHEPPPPDSETSSAASLSKLVGREPAPDFALQVAEEYQHLLDRLDDLQLQLIAQRKMEGHTNRDIADEFNCAVPTIERRLRMIRKCWEQEFDPQVNVANQP